MTDLWAMDWDVELVLDGAVRRFWRCKLERDGLWVSYGTIGTEGQAQKRLLETPEEGETLMEQLEARKRKQGYRAGRIRKPIGKKQKHDFAHLLSEKRSKKAEVKLLLQYKVLTTQVVETFPNGQAARETFERVKETMVKAGYQRLSSEPEV